MAPTPRIPPEGPLDTFAVVLAGSLAFGTLAVAALLFYRELFGSWRAALAPFAAGTVYAIGLGAVDAAGNRVRTSTAATRLVVLALPSIGAAAGSVWWLMVPPPDRTLQPLAIGLLVGLAHGVLAVRALRRESSS